MCIGLRFRVYPFSNMQIQIGPSLQDSRLCRGESEVEGVGSRLQGLSDWTLGLGSLSCSGFRRGFAASTSADPAGPSST